MYNLTQKLLGIYICNGIKYNMNKILFCKERYYLHTYIYNP